MSWQILLMEFPAEVRSMSELPVPYRHQSLGEPNGLAARLKEAFPGIEFEEPTWGVFTGPGFSLQIDLGDLPEVDHLTLHVQGGGDDALKAIWRATRLLGVRAVEVLTGELLNFEEDPHGFRVLRGLHTFSLDPEDSVF